MTYNLLLTGELDHAVLTAALVELFTVPPTAVDVTYEDSTEWNRDALVSCSCVRAERDVTWELDVYIAEVVTSPPGETEVAAQFSRRFGYPVLCPAESNPPSAYWLAAPDGLVTRARVDNVATEDSDHAELVIEAVERSVASLPGVPVILQPEVIHEHRMPTPLSDTLSVLLEKDAVSEDIRFLVRARLGAWESLTARMMAGWLPDGWYPADLYREMLKARDEVQSALSWIPTEVSDQFSEALAEIDDKYRTLTVVNEVRAAEDLDVSEFELALHDWWWHRLLEPPPWAEGHPVAGFPGASPGLGGVRPGETAC
jgi:hypothetical protein